MHEDLKEKAGITLDTAQVETLLAPAKRGGAMSDGSGIVHLDIVRMIERLHRRYLDLVRVELTRNGINDLSPSQVMMLLTIGAEELSVRDLIDRGYYLGSNASYSLKRLVETGYVDRATSERDKRSACIRLSEKGHKLCDMIKHIDEAYHQLIAATEEELRELQTTYRTLKRLEQAWTNAVRYGGNPGGI